MAKLNDTVRNYGTSIHKAEHNINELEKELAAQKFQFRLQNDHIKRLDRKIKEQSSYLTRWIWLTRFIGWGLIIFNLAYEGMAERLEWQYTHGWAMRQWAMFIAGWVLVIVTMKWREK